jgi:hypothetical protein
MAISDIIMCRYIRLHQIYNDDTFFVDSFVGVCWISSLLDCELVFAHNQIQSRSQDTSVHRILFLFSLMDIRYFLKGCTLLV